MNYHKHNNALIDSILNLHDIYIDVVYKIETIDIFHGHDDHYHDEDNIKFSTFRLPLMQIFDKTNITNLSDDCNFHKYYLPMYLDMNYEIIDIRLADS